MTDCSRALSVHGRRQLDGRRWVDVLVMMPDGSEQVGDVIVVELVADVAAVAARVDQAQGAQQPQMVRGRAEAEIRGRSEILYRLFAGQHLGQEPEAAG